MLDSVEKFQSAFEKLEDADEAYRDFFEVDSPLVVKIGIMLGFLLSF